MLKDGERLALSSAFHSAYFRLLRVRVEDERYPRMDFRIAEVKTHQGNFVPIQATRQLIVDHSRRQFEEEYKKTIKEAGGAMSKREMQQRAAQIFQELEFGHMHRFADGSLSNKGPFKGMQLVTNKDLLVEEGTLGVIEHIEPDFYPVYFGVHWEGFGPDNPGRFAWIPSVSLHIGGKYYFELFRDKEPEELGITVHKLIRQYSEHPKYSNLR